MKTNKKQRRLGKRQNHKRRGRALCAETLSDRIMFAADLVSDVVVAKEIPAEVSAELTSGSKSSDTGKSSDAQGKTIPGTDVHALLITSVGLAKKEAADSNKDAGGKDKFRMGELQTGSKDAKEATTNEPSLQNKEQLSFGGPKIEVEQHVEDHLPHSKLEEIEGLERMEPSQLDDVMSERSAETERYGEVERDSLMSEFSNPNSLLDEFLGDPNAEPDPGQMTEDSVLGYGMASGLKDLIDLLPDIIPNSKPRDDDNPYMDMMRALEEIPGGGGIAVKITNHIHNYLLEKAEEERKKAEEERKKEKQETPKCGGEGQPACKDEGATVRSGLDVFDRAPGPNGDTGSEAKLPGNHISEALAKLFALYGQQPWVGTAGQPVPDDDGGTPFDFAAASEVFSQLARQDWNPMIVQPGPDGDMEYNYLGMKELPGDLGFMKLQMAGQPVPDDPDWGTGDGGKGSSNGGNFNPQPVTTQRPAAAAESRDDAEVPQKKE